jgi:alkanesulfonate monooxygenase SsuD/methylene tetrahydromethanopterin reductase-like flavin-dependent oxidoreductase (luciferase family)
MPSPSVILAAASQRTKKMLLGAAVSILPMHNPLRIAEEFAMVDQLSNGRLCFGAGRGMHPIEYAVFGYEWSDAQKRLPEALDIVMRAWSGEEFEWQSENYKFRKLRVYPEPVQRPHPPIYITANRDPDSFHLVGSRGHHLMTLPWIATNEEQGPRVRMYQDALRAAGHSVEDKDSHHIPSMSATKTSKPAEVVEHCTLAASLWKRQVLCRNVGLRDALPHLSYDAMARQPRRVRRAGDLRAHLETHHRNRRHDAYRFDLSLRRAQPGQGAPIDGALRPRGAAGAALRNKYYNHRGPSAAEPQRNRISPAKAPSPQSSG